MRRRPRNRGLRPPPSTTRENGLPLEDELLREVADGAGQARRRRRIPRRGRRASGARAQKPFADAREGGDRRASATTSRILVSIARGSGPVDPAESRFSAVRRGPGHHEPRRRGQRPARATTAPRPDDHREREPRRTRRASMPPLRTPRQGIDGGAREWIIGLLRRQLLGGNRWCWASREGCAPPASVRRAACR